MMATDDASFGLILSDDLIFTSRVTGTARAGGMTVQPARSPELLEQLARQKTPACVLVDLSNPGLEIETLIEKLRTACVPMPRIVAYGSHVDTATLRRAREAGCDVVLPRSKFVEDLPVMLADWMKTKASP